MLHPPVYRVDDAEIPFENPVEYFERVPELS